MCLPHEVPPGLSLVSPESKVVTKPQMTGDVSLKRKIGGGFDTGKKERPIQECLTMLASASGNWYSISLQPSESLEMSLSIPHLGNENGKQLSIISSPFGSRVAPLVLSPCISKAAHAWVQDFPRNLMTATESPQVPEENDKGPDKGRQCPPVQKWESYWTSVGWLPSHEMLHPSQEYSRGLLGIGGEDWNLLTSPLVLSLFTWGWLCQARLAGVVYPMWLVGHTVQPLVEMVGVGSR